MKDTMRNELGAPAVVDRGTFQAELDALRVREKAHTREGDAIALIRLLLQAGVMALRQMARQLSPGSVSPGSNSVTSRVRAKKGDVSDFFETPPSFVAHRFLESKGHPLV